MKRVLLAAIVVLVVGGLFAGNYDVEAQQPGVKAWAATGYGQPAETTDAPQKLERQAVEERLGRLNFVERRRLGLTIRNIMPVVKDLKASGIVDDDTPKSVTAALIMEELVQQNTEAYAAPGVDWDAILDFIERLLPLILQLISLFG